MREPQARNSNRPPGSAHAVGIDGIDLSPLALAEPSTFIRAARQGMPGTVVKQAVGVLGHRELFVRLLGTTAGNLNRYYRRKRLGQAQSEAMLDTLRLVSQAASAFGGLESANEWLGTALPRVGWATPHRLLRYVQGAGARAERHSQDRIRRVPLMRSNYAPRSRHLQSTRFRG